MITIDVDPKFYNNVLAQIKMLSPIYDIEIKAHFTNGVKASIILNVKEDQKEFIESLKMVGSSNGILNVE